MALVGAALVAGIFVMVLALVSLGTATGFLTQLAAEPLGAAPHLETTRASSDHIVVASNVAPTANVDVASAAPIADTTAAPEPTPVAVPVAIVSASSGGGGAAPTPSAAAPADLGGAGGASNGGSSGSIGIAGFAGAAGALGSGPTSPAVAVLELLDMGASQACGNNTCNVGLVCCNHSCGTCAPPGASCDQSECENAATFPAAIPCGLNSCSQGQVCCNQSCGLCAAPGEACSQEICS
jgi:hypothetical protein